MFVLISSLFIKMRTASSNHIAYYRVFFQIDLSNHSRIDYLGQSENQVLARLEQRVFFLCIIL